MSDMVYPIPHNVGEAVIAPFWADGLHDFDRWTITVAADTGARVYKRWSMVAFDWVRSPKDGPVFSMRREMTVDCTGYDAATLRCVLPGQCTLRMVLETDRGTRTLLTAPGDGVSHEHRLPLDGAAGITSILLECHATQSPSMGGLFWIGLENAMLLRAHLDMWRQAGRINWRHYLRPDMTAPIAPELGIFLDPATLPSLREKHARYVAQYGTSPFLQTRDTMRATPPDPERLVADYTSATGSILTRERDAGRPERLAGKAWQAAMAGIILEDNTLLEYAVQYAVITAICEKWTESFISALPGCEFETRSFFQGQAMADIAVVLDLAGGLLSWHGKEYLQRRLAEYGLGNINYVVWRHDTIHQCNQMPAFSFPRLLAYLVLERAWPRVCPYTDLAVAELGRSLANIIRADGSFTEGPHYLQYALQTALPAYYHFARARGLPFHDVLPDVVRNTARYAEAFASTDASQEFIPHNDGGTDNRIVMEDAVVFLAAMLPESHWVTAYWKHRNRQASISPMVYVWELEDTLPRDLPRFSPCVHLQTGGILASYREWKGLPVKIMVIGSENAVGGGHQQEDYGSFVLEFAGETFAMDSGTYSYDNIHASLFQMHDRHNVLAPAGLTNRALMHPTKGIPIRPQGSGDEKTFHATMDLSRCWPDVASQWIRAWDSVSPDTLVIRDHYDFTAGTGVEWYWLTVLDVVVSGRDVVISGKRGRLCMTVPDDCVVRVDHPSMPDERRQTRIVFARHGRTGMIEVRCRLACPA